MLITKRQLREEARDKIVAEEAKTFDKEAQQVWAEKDVFRKKELIETLIISQFQYQKKQEEFRTKIRKTNSSYVLDKLVADIVMFSHGEKVLK